MSTKDLAAKYGTNKSSVQLINAAIRAELTAGNEFLDALEIAHKAAGRKDDPAISSVGRVLSALRTVKAAMAAEIRRRYGMPPAVASDDANG